MAFLLRFALAFALLAATFNPTGISYLHWALQAEGSLPLKVLAGAVLVGIYAIFVTAVFRGIGAFGVLLVAIMAGAAVWVMVDWGWISLDRPGAVTWVLLVALAFVLAVGMYWGVLWRRLSGQIETDDRPE